MAIALYFVMLIMMIMFAHYMFLFLKEWQKTQDKVSELNLENFSLQCKNGLLETEVNMLKMQIEMLERRSEYWYQKTSDLLNEDKEKPEDKEIDMLKLYKPIKREKE